MRRFWSCVAVVPAVVLFTPVAAASPVASVIPGVFHPPINVHSVENDNVSSTNWSGFAVAATSQFTQATGSWVQPTATCKGLGLGHTYASFWVGLDGYSSSSVEQLGTDSDCGSSNSPSYYAWYEMYPAASVSLSSAADPVKPGDTLTATVSRSGTSYTLSLKSSEGWTFSTTKTGTDANASAEWIAESPSICTFFACRNASLTNFGSVTFSGSDAADGGTLLPVSSFTTNNGPHDITMTTATGTTRAKPSSLSATGDGFTDTWFHS